MIAYAERELAEGTPLKAMTRHMLGLFQGLPGARAWRRELSETAHRAGAGSEMSVAALAQIRADRRRAAA